MTGRSKPLLVLTLASCIAMPSACTPSRIEPKTAPDPIVTTRTIARMVCPAEVTAPAPPVVDAYVGAAIDATKGYFDWLAGHMRREKLLGQRLNDAAKECPHG